MSTNNRHPERGARENTVYRRETEPNTFPQTSQSVHNPSVKHPRFIKDTEQHSKIGRRYSFDDNGGGYQGL